MSVINYVQGAYSDLKNSRYNWESMWQDIAEYMIPIKADFTVQNTPGTDRRSHIFDTTAVQSVERFASALHNMLTSSSTPWFVLDVNNPALKQDKEVAGWLQYTARAILAHLNSVKSGFHPSVFEFYQELAAFGTACLMIEDIPAQGAFIRHVPLQRLWIGCDMRGGVNQVYRCYDHSLAEVVNLYEDVPDRLRELAVKNPSEKITCVHGVFETALSPKGELPSKIKKKYASVYFLPDYGHVLRVGQFDQLPYVVSRWKRNSGESYGRSCGMNALADAKLLNEMRKTHLKAAQKTVDPPVMIPDDGFITPVRTFPGGINYFRAGLGPNDRIQPLQTGARLDLSQAMMGEVRQDIIRNFYLDQLELPGPTAPDGDVYRFSATEIIQRRQQQMQTLGPMVSRQESEFMEPLINRVLAIMIKNQMIPPLPKIQGQEIEVGYTNPVSVALRTPELGSISQLFQFALPLAQIDQGILQQIDFRESLKLAADVLRVPVQVLKSDAQIQQEAAEAQRAQQMQMQMQQLQALGQQQELQSRSLKNQAQAEAAFAQAGEQ